MHVISHTPIREAKIKFPEAANALEAWYRIVIKNKFDNFSELKRVFGSVDKVDDYYVFDIGDNKIRLIAFIHFNRQKIYVHDILNHSEYEKGRWKK